MNTEKDYGSESDSSDEDFCPEENAGNQSSDEDIEDEDAEDLQETAEEPAKVNVKKKGKLSKKKNAKKVIIEIESKRQTRHGKESADVVGKSAKQEKEELESDDEDKGRADALWADFLGDVQKPTIEEKKPVKVSSSIDVKKDDINEKPKSRDADAAKRNGSDDAPKEITITEILDFAGEEIRVEKTVPVDSVKENNATTVGKMTTAVGKNIRGLVPGLKRSAPSSSSSSSGGSSGSSSSGGGGGTGLGSLLNQIGKKKKISVLEKTKLDWNSFKKDEGIEEEIQTFNKGKDGFLERQDFLERTDVRQFEIERNLRQSRRKH